MIAKHDIETLIFKRRLFRGRVDETYTDIRSRCSFTRMLELARRVIQRDAARTAFRKRDRPRGCAAAVFENVAARNVAEQSQFRFRE